MLVWLVFLEMLERKPTKNGRKKKQVNVTLDEMTYAALKEKARREESTPSQLGRLAIKKLMEPKAEPKAETVLQ